MLALSNVNAKIPNMQRKGRMNNGRMENEMEEWKN
jgi:hypothetical protein